MKKLITCLLLVLVAAPLALAQGGSNDIKENDFNPVNTGVTTLGIAPDARSTGMGYLGAATDPDVNSQYWNPSKYAFGYSQGGMALSYTPWLRKIVNDIFLAELAGYWKPGSGDNQAISASFRYFSLGEVTFGGNQTGGGAVQTINPYEMAFDLGYSRKLSEHFSMGVVLRYILSDLSWTDTYTSESNSAASAFSRASASSSASATRKGSVIANVEPRPTTLSTAISPPIRSTRLLVMVMPRPVPSVLLA